MILLCKKADLRSFENQLFVYYDDHANYHGPFGTVIR